MRKPIMSIAMAIALISVTPLTASAFVDKNGDHYCDNCGKYWELDCPCYDDGILPKRDRDSWDPNNRTEDQGGRLTKDLDTLGIIALRYHGRGDAYRSFLSGLEVDFE